MEDIHPPIFAVARHGIDVSVFASVEGAEGFLEPIDVVNEEDVLYDALGRGLVASVEGKRTRIRTESETPRRDDLPRT